MGQMSGEEPPAAVAAIGALGDRLRRAFYRYIATQGRPVGREEAAVAMGVPPHVARFHLDRLHAAGLLEVEYKRPPGRGGPGAGRPAKLYRPAAIELSVSVPERRYDLAGLVLTRAIATATESDTPIAQALADAASQTGRALGQAARSQTGRPPHQPPPLAATLATLEANGFAPRAENDHYVLGNCPFRALAQQAPQVVCQMNLALITGLLEQAGDEGASAQLDPADGRCCVTIRA
jgi:predicted ArsR family transcriptional regulator